MTFACLGTSVKFDSDSNLGPNFWTCREVIERDRVFGPLLRKAQNGDGLFQVSKIENVLELK